MEIEKFEVAKLELKKGDILVVRVPEGENTHRIAKDFKDLLLRSGYDNGGIIVTKNGMEISIVSKDDAQDPDPLRP